MKRIIFGLMCSGLMLGFSTSSLRADDKSEADRLGPPVRHVNDSAKKVGTGAALRSISVETGIPQEQVEKLHREYPDANIAGVMMAGVMSDETKRPPEDFLKRHKDGKSWPEIAHENRVPVDKVIERLDRLDRHLTRPAGEREVKRR